MHTLDLRLRRTDSIGVNSVQTGDAFEGSDEPSIITFSYFEDDASLLPA